MASVGHIMELANSGSYCNSGVDPANEFTMDIRVASEKYEVVKKLKEQAASADLIYLMSDGDREGEVISWSLLKFLKISKEKCRRAITHEITPKAVVQAIEHPTKINDNLVEAGLARLALDKIVGFRLSPIAKTYIGAKSVGRCQSCGLKIIVDREKEIQNFKPESYYDLYLSFEKNKTRFKAKYVGTDSYKIEHLKDTSEVQQVKDACTGEYIVKDIIKKEKQESPKPPFITATLQQELSTQLNLKIKDAMSICQKNFEDGFTTYHRVDVPILSNEFIEAAQRYIEQVFGKDSYAGPRQVKVDENVQNGHEAIRCTDITLTPEKAKDIIKNDLQWKVYCIIWKRTIQSLMHNAVYDSQIITISNNDQLFEMEQKVLKSPGFKILD